MAEKQEYSCLWLCYHRQPKLSLWTTQGTQYGVELYGFVWDFLQDIFFKLLFYRFNVITTPGENNKRMEYGKPFLLSIFTFNDLHGYLVENPIQTLIIRRQIVFLVWFIKRAWAACGVMWLFASQSVHWPVTRSWIFAFLCTVRWCLRFFGITWRHKI